MNDSRLYAIDKLARLAGVSVRTLRHYDQLGLLKPSARSDARHRLYSYGELLRLQQILFYRELDFALGEIKLLLDQTVDIGESLRKQRSLLVAKQSRLSKLIGTLDKTILTISQNTMLTDEELYEGFSQEEIAEIKAEVKDKYDPAIVAESNRRVAHMSRTDWAKIKAEGGAITLGLAEMKRAGAKIDDERVQALVQRQFDWISHFYTPTKEIFAGLGELYVADPRFTKNYDIHEPGLAAFFKEAIDYYCKHTMASL